MLKRTYITENYPIHIGCPRGALEARPGPGEGTQRCLLVSRRALPEAAARAGRPPRGTARAERGDQALLAGCRRALLEGARETPCELAGLELAPQAMQTARGRSQCEGARPLRPGVS